MIYPLNLQRQEIQSIKFKTLFRIWLFRFNFKHPIIFYCMNYFFYHLLMIQSGLSLPKGFMPRTVNIRKFSKICYFNKFIAFLNRISTAKIIFLYMNNYGFLYYTQVGAVSKIGNLNVETYIFPRNSPGVYLFRIFFFKFYI